MSVQNPYTKKPWLSSYPNNVPENVDVPLLSIGEMFNDICKKYPNRAAVYFYGKKICYQDLNEKINRFGNALNGLGLSSRHLNRTEESSQYHNLALSKFIQIKNQTGTARALNNLGIVLLSRAESEMALNYVKLAYKIHQNKESIKGQVRALLNLGLCYYKDNLDKALEYFLIANQLAKEHEYHFEEASANLNIGEVYYQRKSRGYRYDREETGAR